MNSFFKVATNFPDCLICGTIKCVVFLVLYSNSLHVSTQRYYLSFLYVKYTIISFSLGKS